MTVFFTSDHHFGDARRLGIDRRPFPSGDAMDDAMRERWNGAVAPEDEVWHLGDLTRWTDSGRIGQLLASLHGIKHLVAGNNDGPATRTHPGFASVVDYAEIVVDDRALVLCHYPFRTWNRMGRGAINLHGHSHGRLGPRLRQYDVGVDARDFRPVRLAEILATRTRPKRTP
ncbi:metallophosphoesterase [uncultured Enterovirga sp.]|uniref:metallophosphoesterase n=1 Tax=uncultured Enterovirga sp. TaxID=2026352 RepID=UPI0035CC04C8